MSTLKKSILLVFIVLAAFGVFAHSTLAEKAQSTEGGAPPAAEAPIEASKLVVYYFHGNLRCTSCKKIEAYTKEALQTEFAASLKAGQLEIRTVNIETPGNEHFVQDFQLYTRSVVLERRLNGKQEGWKNLDKVWSFVRNQEAFKDYVKKEVRSMLEGNAA